MSFVVNGNIDQFLNEMGKVPLLTAAEEIMLGNAVQRGQAEDATPSQKRAGMKAKNRMIQANLRLVVRSAANTSTAIEARLSGAI